MKHSILTAHYMILSKNSNILLKLLWYKYLNYMGDSLHAHIRSPFIDYKDFLDRFYFYLSDDFHGWKDYKIRHILHYESGFYMYFMTQKNDSIMIEMNRYLDFYNIRLLTRYLAKDIIRTINRRYINGFDIYIGKGIE